MPSELENAMESLIKVFHRYASKDGKTGTLNRRELRELMENELSNFLKVRRDNHTTRLNSAEHVMPFVDYSHQAWAVKEFSWLLSQSQKDPAAVDKIMKDLDANGDGQVDFEEFVSLVVGLSIACEQCYQMHMKKMAKK